MTHAHRQALALSVSVALIGACNNKDSDEQSDSVKKAQTDTADVAPSSSAAAKDCCMGLNSCKGKGGCAVPESHACAGQNECAGKGGCHMNCPK